uniref:Uncharacterized protein n=1 Tax=Anguilla anguilla TaxID=7936 RepID=A0A0E9XHB5_ANGAN
MLSDSTSERCMLMCGLVVLDATVGRGWGGSDQEVISHICIFRRSSFLLRRNCTFSI